MVTVLLSAGLVLALALLIAIYGKLSGLPVAVWSLARKEREANAAQALDAMKEAVAARAGASIVAIRQYEEQLGAGFRIQVAEAEMRARMAERRAADTVVALEAAAALVRELRLVLDVVEARRGGSALPRPVPARPPPPAEGDGERETIEVPPGGGRLPIAAPDGALRGGGGGP